MQVPISQRSHCGQRRWLTPPDLNPIDDVGAVDAVGRQINALGGEMPKRRTALFVDCSYVTQVKPDRFSPRKSLNTGGFDRLDSFA
jgi:hypothetical protein